jgi:CubicO group peptidase (beta-lactamase class C family)
VTKYIPELKDSAYADATVRQVMDMTIGVQYSENYADPKPRYGITRAPVVCCRQHPVTAGLRFLRFSDQTEKRRRTRSGLCLQDGERRSAGVDSTPRVRSVFV